MKLNQILLEKIFLYYSLGTNICSVSAVTFLEYWKRKSASLAHHWDCMGFQDEEERPRWGITASPKVLKIFSHPQTRDQSQVVQNDKLSQESVETKIFVGGNGTFSHFFEKKLKKMWKKISKKFFFLLKFVFLG